MRLFIEKTMVTISTERKTANSYCSLEEANVYFDTRLNTKVWTEASDEDKSKALIMATRNIETLNFKGRKEYQGQPGSDTYQSLQWPRLSSEVDQYMLGIPWLMLQKQTRQANWYNDSWKPIIPKELIYATCEQAFYLMRSIEGIDKREGLRAQGFDGIDYVGATEKWTTSARTIICPAAMRFLNSIDCLESGYRLERG